MASQCVPTGSVQRAADAPLTPPTKVDTFLSSIDPVERHEMVKEAARQAQHRANVDEAAGILNGKNYIGQTPTKQDERAARQTSRALAKQINADIEAATQRNLETAQEMMNLVNGTTVARGSWWVNMKNKLYGAFVSSNAELNKYLAHYAHMSGLPAQYANKLIRMAERIPAVARSIAAKFEAQQQSIIDACVPLANQCGMDAKDFYVLAGHWQLCRHMPYRNTHLLQKWQEELTKLQQEATPDPVRVADLQHRIENLERFRNSDLSDYDEARDGQLYHGGFTDKQAADWQQKILQQTGVSAAELDRVGDMFTDAFNNILQERIRLGLVPPGTRIPENLQHYVPAISRDMEGFNNYTGAANDATPYNPGSYYAMSGRTSAPDSPAVTLGIYGQRAAAEIATRDFGYMLNALELKQKNENTAGKLRSIKYSEMMRRMNAHVGGPMHDAFQTMYNRGGMVATVPREYVNAKTGARSVEWEKRFFYFEGPSFTHEGTTFDTGLLNKAISASYKLAEPGPLVGALAKGTTGMGQLTTRFTVLFSPVSGSRDLTERAFNMANRTYLTADGQEISGGAMISSYLANVPRAGRMLLDGMAGRLDPNTNAGRMWQEFLDFGLAQKFSERTRVSDQSISDLLERRQIRGEGIVDALARNESTAQLAEKLKMTTPVLNRLSNSFGKNKRRFLNKLDQWNDYWQNIAAFDHYMTLREKGVRASDAADYVLEMMNMNQRGSLAPWLQALAPFVVPTVQSGTAFLRTMGFGADSLKGVAKSGWKGYMAIVGAYGAYSILMPLAKDSMGYDENGRSRFDALSIGEASRMLPMGIGDDGEYLRIATGFGGPQIGALLAIGSERVADGRMSISDLAFEVMFALMKNVAPGNWPEYQFSDKPAEYIMTMLTPMPFRPIAETAMNTNYFGNELYRDAGSDGQSKAEAGRTSTPRKFHEWARFARDVFGVDTYPEVLEHLERGYALGPIRGLVSLAGDVDNIYKGGSRPSVLDSVHPLLAAMGITSWMGKVADPERSLYYEGKRHYDSLIRNMGLDLAAPKGVDAETYKREVLTEAGLSPEEVEDFITIWNVQKTLQQQGRDFNEQYKDRWRSMETSDELRAAFEDLDTASHDVYADAVSRLYYYNG